MVRHAPQINEEAVNTQTSTPNIQKALTVYQPWATLISLGLKHNETRPRQTHYRGRLAIHAGREYRHLDKLLSELRRNKTPDTMTPWAANIATIIMDNAHLFAGRELADFFPVSAIVGMVTVKAMHAYPYAPPVFDARETLLGEYGPGRVAWELVEPEYFKQPIPMNGKQGLWNWIR